jgi:hypothetical protein
MQVSVRPVLLTTLAVAWLNFLLTTKWAAFSGALNGPKRPWYAAALVIATAAALVGKRVGQPVRLPGLALLVAGGWAMLAAAFLFAFPPSTWNLIPFFDDWPPRFQSTVEGLRLLGHGAVTGWQWNFLGGYQTSADLSQSLTILGAIPMTIFGDRLGFHLLHALMFAGIPLMVYLDIAAEQNGPRDVTRLTGFFALVTAAGLFGTVTPSGDTNSIAGVFCAVMAMSGSRAARLGRRWGGALLTLGLTLALYSHAAFFGYASVYLLLEAFFYRDRRMAIRFAVAAVAACLAALPQFWELLVYPQFFQRNNLLYAPAPIDWPGVAKQVFYNTEILFHPHRWFNDYLSLTKVFLLVFVWVAVRARPARAGFYAWAVLATIVMLRFDVLETGFLVTRSMHMMAALAAPPLAWFVVQQSGHRVLAYALIAVIGLYVQTQFIATPHLAGVRDFDPALVDRLGMLDGNLVLVEQSPHRDLNAALDQRTERTPFNTHFEALLPDVTHRRFYSQSWDTWHWTPFRGQVLAGGAIRGQAINEIAVNEFVAEMRKWGVKHLVVWSDPTKTYLEHASDVFVRRWTSGLWVQYEMVGADPRSVVTSTGSGALEDVDSLEGNIKLSGIAEDDLVVVRMNYFPAWRATADQHFVPLTSVEGQLAFRAPKGGTYTVELHYPKRIWLTSFALAILIAGSLIRIR